MFNLKYLKYKNKYNSLKKNFLILQNAGSLLDYIIIEKLCDKIFFHALELYNNNKNNIKLFLTGEKADQLFYFNKNRQYYNNIIYEICIININNSTQSIYDKNKIMQNLLNCINNIISEYSNDLGWIFGFKVYDESITDLMNCFSLIHNKIYFLNKSIIELIDLTDVYVEFSFLFRGLTWHYDENVNIKSIPILIKGNILLIKNNILTSQINPILLLNLTDKDTIYYKEIIPNIQSAWANIIKDNNKYSKFAIIFSHSDKYLNYLSLIFVKYISNCYRKIIGEFGNYNNDILSRNDKFFCEKYTRNSQILNFYLLDGKFLTKQLTHFNNFTVEFITYKLILLMEKVRRKYFDLNHCCISWLLPYIITDTFTVYSISQYLLFPNNKFPKKDDLIIFSLFKSTSFYPSHKHLFKFSGCDLEPMMLKIKININGLYLFMGNNITHEVLLPYGSTIKVDSIESGFIEYNNENNILRQNCTIINATLQKYIWPEQLKHLFNWDELEPDYIDGGGITLPDEEYIINNKTLDNNTNNEYLYPDKQIIFNDNLNDLQISEINEKDTKFKCNIDKYINYDILLNNSFIPIQNNINEKINNIDILLDNIDDETKKNIEILIKDLF